ncbi:hypothetical protein [Streptomyces sp. NPDC057909]|uniref:hypothetical protein n=1 Tax=Streptomyces sp. NPDC057909 TaxID=3346277 RepID=UPI0036E7B1D4
MSKKSRLMTFLAMAGVAVTALAGTAGTANAALLPRSQTITPSLNLFVHDEDGSVDDQQAFNGIVLDSRRVGIGAPASWKVERCVDEVRTVLLLSAFMHDDGKVYTQADTYLFEGASCATTDQDGRNFIAGSQLAPISRGGSAQVSDFVQNVDQSEYSLSTPTANRDYASFSLLFKSS